MTTTLSGRLGRGLAAAAAFLDRHPRLLAWAGVGLVAAGALAPHLGEAGSALGWATAAQTLEGEGETAGGWIAGLGICTLGAGLWQGAHGLTYTGLGATAGGALMSNATAVSAALFHGGGGGGSVFDAAFDRADAVQAALHALAPLAS